MSTSYFKRWGRIVLILGFLTAIGFSAVVITSWNLAFARIAEEAGALDCAGGASAAIAVFYSDDPLDRDARIRAGLGAARACPQSLVFFLGGARPFRNYFGSEEMAQSFRTFGVGQERLRSERNSHDTRTNVAALANLAKANGVARVFLVSDPFHLVRIRHEIARLNLEFALADLATGQDASWRHVVWRGCYEAMAWASLALPDKIRQSLLSAIGRTAL